MVVSRTGSGGAPMRNVTDAERGDGVVDLALGVGLRRRLERMDPHAAEAEVFVETPFREARRGRTVLSWHRTHRCPPVWCREFGDFLVRRTSPDGVFECDGVGKAFLPSHKARTRGGPTRAEIGI